MRGNANLQEKVIKYIKEHPGGVLQNQLGKELQLDSKKCSKIIKRLVDLGKVQRNWEKVGSVRTYRIVYNDEKIKPKPKAKRRRDPELKKISIANGEVFPCLGCVKYPENCEPTHCKILDGWVYLLGTDG